PMRGGAAERPVIFAVSHCLRTPQPLAAALHRFVRVRGDLTSVRSRRRLTSVRSTWRTRYSARPTPALRAGGLLVEQVVVVVLGNQIVGIDRSAHRLGSEIPRDVHPEAESHRDQ